MAKLKNKKHPTDKICPNCQGGSYNIKESKWIYCEVCNDTGWVDWIIKLIYKCTPKCEYNEGYRNKGIYCICCTHPEGCKFMRER